MGNNYLKPSINSISSETDKLQSQIDDLIKQKQQLELQIKNHESLSTLLLECHELETIEGILYSTGKFLSNLLPNSIIMVLHSIPETNLLRLYEIFGIDNFLLKQIIDKLGYNIKGHDFEIIENTRAIYEHTTLTEIKGGLKEFAQGAVPDFAADFGQKLLGIKKIFTIGIAGNRNIFGNLHILTRKETELVDSHLIETIIYQASVAIGRLQYFYQLKESEAKIRKNIEELEILNAAKDRFFSILAHDLRAPFHILLSVSALLSTDIEDLSQEEIKEFAQRLYDISANHFNLLNDLLEWAKVQKYDPLLTSRNINLRSITETVTGSMLYIAEEKNILIDNQIDKQVEAFADPNMLKLVIRNLLVNAIKFSPTNKSISVLSFNKNGMVETIVEDRGIGIEKRNIDKLFRIDVSFTTPGTADEKGTGLGLQLCKEIIEKHGGTIRVESEIGIGSKFIFTLPASRV